MDEMYKNNERIEKDFQYISIFENHKSQICKKIYNYVRDLAYIIEHECPSGREKSLVFTKLQEALMWAEASINRNE